MDYMLLTIIIIGAALALTGLAIMITYWFELDEKFLRLFEPAFRKMTD